jgi:hypothetical protein
MKLVGYYIVFGLFICSCGSSKKEWADFRNADCAKYQFGRIDAKRVLTDNEKKSLAQQGIQVQEFVFETQYLGSWEVKWSAKNLDKTPIKSLIPFSTQDKLASGMQIQELKKLADSPGESMVLIQTIATVNNDELSKYGKLIFKRDYFYRMLVPHNQLLLLLEFPCLRLMSIVKDNYDPDKE